MPSQVFRLLVVGAAFLLAAAPTASAAPSPEAPVAPNPALQPLPPGESPPTDHELARPDRFNKATSAVRELGRSRYADTFAGVVVNGDSVEILSTKPLSGADNGTLARPLEAEGIRVGYRVVQYTSEHLDNIVAKVSSSLRDLRAAGREVTSVGIRDDANVVAITVLDKVEENRTHFTREFGAAVSVEQAEYLQPASTRSDSPGLFKAGTQVNLTLACTAGFAVHAWNGYPLFLTAGHCGNIGNEAHHGGTRIGWLSSKTFVDGGNMDTAIVSLDQGQISNWLFQGNHWLTPIHGFSTAAIGAPVCSEGISSGHRCGTVNLRNGTFTYSGPNAPTIHGLDCADFSSQSGDSGGPVYNFTTGVGIVAAESPGRTCYTPVERTLAPYAISPVTGAQLKKLPIDLTGKCFDYDNAGGGLNGHKVQQWECLGASQQNQSFWIEPVYTSGHWGEFYTIKSQWNGKCLDFDIAGNTGNGGKVQQWECIPNQLNQQFHFLRGAGLSTAFQSVSNGRCIDLDIAVAPYANGTKLQQWDCNMQRQQRQTLREAWM